MATQFRIIGIKPLCPTPNETKRFDNVERIQKKTIETESPFIHLQGIWDAAIHTQSDTGNAGAKAFDQGNGQIGILDVVGKDQNRDGQRHRCRQGQGKGLNIVFLN